MNAPEIVDGEVIPEEAPLDPKRDWVLDEAARARIDVALADIDGAQSAYPKCSVCGQRSARLDRFGSCSKSSDVHRQHRNEFREAKR